jgi:type IV pilus assembly protein PilV
MNRFSRPAARGQRGIALLEALLAIVVLAIGLLGTIGMQARSYSALSEASMRAEATIATESLLGVMASDQANLAKYALAAGPGATPSAELMPWYTATRASIPGAQVVITIAAVAGTARSEVDITLSWTRKAGGPTNVHQVTSYIST